MDEKFYKLIVKGNNKVGGVLYAPEKWPYPIASDGINVENWETLTVTLKDGEYRPFHLCVGGANMVSEEFKKIIEDNAGEDSDLEFLPVKAYSDKYGDRVYYIMHFKKIYDVIDPKNTVYVEGTNSIIKLRLDFQKAKDLNVFNSQPIINDVIISDKIYKAIKKNKLDLGLEFLPVLYAK